MKLSFRVLLVTIALTGSVFLSIAQPGGGGAPGGGKGPPCANPPCNPVPITGIEYLLGAGALFGIRYLRKKNRRKSDQI